MTQIKTILFIAMFFFVSCRSNRSGSKEKEIIIQNLLSIQVPEEFFIESEKGIDGYTFRLTDNKGFVLKGELGMYANDFAGPPMAVFDRTLKDSILKRSNYKLDTSIVFFSDQPSKDSRMNIFSTQYYLYDTINGILAKLIQPKKIGMGVTAVYMPRLKNNESFVLYSKDLDSTRHLKALEIFRSIKYKE